MFALSLFATIRVSLSHIFSPWIVATTFLLCFAARNSKNQIPCHVPVANLPFVIGMVTLAPINALFTWAGMSSDPSASCLYSPLPPRPFLSSGTIRSRASDMSARTSSSQFYAIVSTSPQHGSPTLSSKDPLLSGVESALPKDRYP